MSDYFGVTTDYILKGIQTVESKEQKSRELASKVLYISSAAFVAVSYTHLYASIALFIFAAVLMMNFIIVSISYRKKDIGILRAIGARSTDVLKIFIWEGVMLAVIS